MTKNYFQRIRMTELIHSLTRLSTTLISENEIILQLEDHSYFPEVIPDAPFVLYTKMLFKEAQIKKRHFKNDYFIEYIGVKIPTQPPHPTAIFVGPFLSEDFTKNHYLQLLLKKKINPQNEEQLMHFYQNLPILSQTEINHIDLLLINLACHPFIEETKKNEITHVQLITEEEQTLSLQTQQSLEERYKEQKKIRQAILKGDVQLAQSFLDNIESLSLLFKDRIKGNYLRVTKNTAIINNTTNRLVAEEAGVHPVLLHQISEKYAIAIEQSRTLHEINELNKNLILEYCQLVHEHHLEKYSPTVRKIIHYIQLHLSENYSLETLAEYIGISKSYLCKIFKAETGTTIIHYIQLLKVEEAKFLLTVEQIPLSEIAYFLGYTDYSYFSRVFKKVTGLSPMDFLKSSPSLKEP